MEGRGGAPVAPATPPQEVRQGEVVEQLRLHQSGRNGNKLVAMEKLFRGANMRVSREHVEEGEQVVV